MKLFLETEYRENYGENGIDYWKNKFGSSYVVENVELDNGNVVGVEEIINMINFSNPVAVETVISWEVLSDNEELPIEPWAHGSLITFYKQDGVWKGKKVQRSSDPDFHLREGIVVMREEWTPLEGLGREDYKISVTMDDGSVLYSQDEIKEWYRTVYTKRKVPDVVVV